MNSTCQFDPPAPPLAPVEATRRRMPQWLFHSIGAMTLIVTSVAFFVALVLISLSLSYCSNSPPTDVEVWRGRGMAALAGLGWVSIPAMMGVIARRTERHSGTWLVVATVGAVLAGVISLSMGPSEFCLF